MAKLLYQSREYLDWFFVTLYKLFYENVVFIFQVHVVIENLLSIQTWLIFAVCCVLLR